jgi:hypothetical protein
VYIQRNDESPRRHLATVPPRGPAE